MPRTASPSAELRPCPFCGADATARKHLTGKSTWWAVGCPSAECVIAPQSVDDSRTIAVAVWNARGDIPAPDLTPVEGCDCALCEKLRKAP